MSEHEKVVAKLPSAAEIAAARAAAESGGQIYGWRDPSGTLLHRIAPDRRWLALIAHQAARLEEVERERDVARSEAEFMREQSIANARERNAAQAALTAAEAEKERLRKALEWRPYPAGGEQAIAAGMARYRVGRNGDAWYLDQDHMGSGGKAAAEADYESRIRAALATDASPSGEPTADDVLRGLASYLGVGGYDPKLTPAQLDKIVRGGIDTAAKPLEIGWRRYNKLRSIGAAPNGTLHLERGLVMVATNLDAWLDRYIETGLPPAPAHAVEFATPPAKEHRHDD